VRGGVTVTRGWYGVSGARRTGAALRSRIGDLLRESYTASGATLAVEKLLELRIGTTAPPRAEWTA